MDEVLITAAELGIDRQTVLRTHYGSHVFNTFK
jgi:hypothetical protein